MSFISLNIYSSQHAQLITSTYYIYFSINYFHPNSIPRHSNILYLFYPASMNMHPNLSLRLYLSHTLLCFINDAHVNKVTQSLSMNYDSYFETLMDPT